MQIALSLYWMLLWIPLLASLIVLLVYLWLWREIGHVWNEEMGGIIGWSIAESLASTTAVGIWLASVTLTDFVIERYNLTLLGLITLFSLLVIVAPFVYNSSLGEPTENEDEYLQKGVVWAYMITSVITLTGILGDIGVAALFLTNNKLVEAGDTGIRDLLGAAFVVVIGALVVTHACKTIYYTVKLQVDKPAGVAPARSVKKRSKLPLL